MRGATVAQLRRGAALRVSIHAPHARGDESEQSPTLSVQLFQSTPLMRGATCGALPGLPRSQFQSTPLMRGATTKAQSDIDQFKFQSTPLMRGATALLDGETITREFQSTPLMRGATFGTRHVILFQQVSIHAPHARGDQSARTSTWPRTCFNPRPSCEGRRARSWCSSSGWEFQSTPLMRGATWVTNVYTKAQTFQSTPLMRGATPRRTASPCP